MAKLQSNICVALIACVMAFGVANSRVRAEDGHTAPAKKKGAPVNENRLAKERSPYLRQHKNNPVDWYPWGPEAFAEAKKKNKLIFLSIGYAACHWCHVMEHESFEDAATAEVMNDAFVCVKVDREERPDIDRVYMDVVQYLRGQGGWPLTAFLTPDGRPFWAETYMPAANVRDIAGKLTKLWREDAERIKHQAAQIAAHINQDQRGSDADDLSESARDMVEALRTAMKARFDADHGGFGRPTGPVKQRVYVYKPKFPPHAALLYGLENKGARSDNDERANLRATLHAMTQGGIHDHVGGGFHRYSTDREWLLPHFEKMLYDNALLLQAYAEGYALFGDASFRRVAERLVGWLDREMKRPGGGYASSLDADTDGEEGTTYTWTFDELKAAMGENSEGLSALVLVSNVGEKGNFLDEATHKFTGRNVLHVANAFAAVAKSWDGKDEAAVRDTYHKALDQLLPTRIKRPQPGLDDKVIAGWNGLLVSAMARASKPLGRPDMLASAKELGSFLWTTCRDEHGALLRFPMGSGSSIPAFCEDYVHVMEGFLDLHEHDVGGEWLKRADALGAMLLAEFEDKQDGGFWLSSLKRGEKLFARSKEAWDSPIPSDNGTAARACLRLHALTGETAYLRAARRTLRAYRPMMSRVHMAPGLISLFRAMSDAPKEGMTSAADLQVQGSHYSTELFVNRLVAKPGSTLDVLVRVRMDPRWHVVASKDALTLTVEKDSDAATLEGVRLPTPATRTVAGDAMAVHDGVIDVRASLRLPEKAPSDVTRIPIRLRLQPCTTDRCLDADVIALDLSIEVSDSNGPLQHASMWQEGTAATK